MIRLGSGVHLHWSAPVPDIGARMARGAAGFRAGASRENEGQSSHCEEAKPPKQSGGSAQETRWIALRASGPFAMAIHRPLTPLPIT